MFEWDENKNQENIKKHGISFEDAKTIFSKPSVTIEDKRASYYEQRFITMGVLNGVIVVIHTERDDITRIISARKATKNEREAYYRNQT